MTWQDRGYPLYLMFQIYQKVLFMDPGALLPRNVLDTTGLAFANTAVTS